MSAEPEPFTMANALDVLQSWSWLYDALKRSEGDRDATDRWVAEGAAKGRNRQCSIGYHEECSDRSGINHNGDCDCPCHQAEWERVATLLRWLDECLSHLAALPQEQTERPMVQGFIDSQPAPVEERVNDDGSRSWWLHPPAQEQTGEVR